jgi:negative regulator of sigma-B (phosphoserine phosphatase)
VTPQSEHRSVPREGETECGDIAIVRATEGATLLAVIDALGHGPLAAAAARLAADHLGAAVLERGLLPLVEGLHAALKGSRGAAGMILLLAPDGRLHGCGVGNVELRSIGSRVPSVLTPGILGASINRLRTFEARVAAGDRLILFSDGLSSRMDLASVRGLAPGAACDALMAQYRRTHDDSTVLVTDIEA